MKIRYTSNVNLADIKSLYAQKINRRQTYVIDLTPEMALPFKLALDFSAQINQKLLNVITKKIQEPFTTKSYDDPMDMWVDMESLGDVTTIKAKELALLLAQGIEDEGRRNPLLLINIDKKSMGIENETILYFIEKFIPDLSVHIFSKLNVKPNFYYDWNLAYRKHSERDSLAESKIYLIKKYEISNDIIYTTIINANNDLSLIESETIQCEPFDFNAKMKKVITHAWNTMLLGAKDSSIQLLKTALEKANDPNCICHYLHALQYIRLITGNFLQAAQQIYPEHITDKQLEKQLNSVKAYCAILSKQKEIAQAHYKKIGLRIHLKWHDRQESLYSCYMLALLMYQSNQTRESCKLVSNVKNMLQTLTGTHTQIEYINALHLGELYVQQNKLSEAKHCFDAAYSTINGLVTESDYILKNVNYAHLYEKLNKIEEAFYCWLRAAMHWASLHHQEALGKRAAKAILNTQSYTNDTPNTEEISAALLHNLNRLATKCHIPVNNDHPLHLIFSRCDYVTSHWHPLRYYATAQWRFIAAKVERPDLFINQSETLTRCLTSILLHLNGAVNFGKANCIVMDNHLSNNITFTKADIIQRCVLLGINNFTYKEIQHTIPTPHYHEFYSAIYVIPSPALSYIELQAQKPRVSFKRFYCDKDINEHEFKILTFIQSQPKPITLNECIAHSSLEKLQQMENDCLIKFTVDKQLLKNVLQRHYYKDQQTV